jgi:putative heme iron utilization protein
MAGVDSQGFYLLIGERVVRVPFDAPVYTEGDVRKALIAMASAA